MPLRRARAVMLQGTGSHVGKSLLTAGLCRVFREAGCDVAPFKAQNMALNAYVTRDGAEIGWAQAVQAEAAGLEPSADMNPILLKPQTGGSQVIVHGTVWATLSARDYYGRRAELWAAVTAAYGRLARAHELIVIEGAGSPAEPNLMAHDLANMAVARHAGAPVVLIGDIDRGGVFASLLGSLALLGRPDRARVRGLLINKFRGDADLLRPGLDFLERRSRRPVLGVVPYVADLHLPEEDSVALDDRAGAGGRIAVVRLPHIANFTDFAPLTADPGGGVRYVRRPEDLSGAGLVVLPGTKDTLADLRWLHATGFVQALRDHVARGGRLGGICGGFQILGRAVEDPEGLEGGGRVEGLGCLPVTTVLEAPKTTRRVRARLAGPKADPKADPEADPKADVDDAFEAYEIHLGRTRPDEAGLPPFAWIDAPEGRRPDGATTSDRRVWGTYLHGLFDAPHVRRALVPETGADRETYRARREREYARLAVILREHVDVAAIQKLAGIR